MCQCQANMHFKVILVGICRKIGFYIYMMYNFLLASRKIREYQCDCCFVDPLFISFILDSLSAWSFPSSWLVQFLSTLMTEAASIS